MRVVIGSSNNVKVQAVQRVVATYGHEVVGVNVKSGVSDQPFSDEETVEGATNRAKEACGFGDVGIGLEAGVAYLNGQLLLVNWGVLVSPSGKTYLAGGTRLPLPLTLQQQLEAGQELGDVIDEFAKKESVRTKEGAIGILTADQLNRTENFCHIVRLLWGQYEFDAINN